MTQCFFSVLSSQFSVLAGTVLLMISGTAFAAEPPASQPAVSELRPILSPEQQREAARQVIDKFVAHVNASPAISAAARAAVAQGWVQHRKDEDPTEFLAAGVAIISPGYKDAMLAMEKEEHEKADAALKPLVEDKDPYVSLHAAAMLARSLVEQERTEEAETVLTPLAARERDLMEKSFLEAEVDFLLGYAQLANLRYDKAMASLHKFEQKFPEAPERLRLPARQMLQELSVRKPESLGEVSDLMVYAGRRLGTGQSDKPVQQKQERAVELLTKLIEQAEEQEQQQNNSNSSGGGGSEGQKNQQGKAGGNQRSNSPALESTLPGGKGRVGDLHRSGIARPGEEWGKMPPEERERVLQSLRRNFPSQYRQLVEQYYRQLGKEK